jgi:hypothetical protein
MLSLVAHTLNSGSYITNIYRKYGKPASLTTEFEKIAKDKSI